MALWHWGPFPALTTQRLPPPRPQGQHGPDWHARRAGTLPTSLSGAQHGACTQRALRTDSLSDSDNIVIG